jgi:hypothetical protein
MHDGLGLVSSAGVVRADNRLYFVSPDRAVYATDGIEVADVSSQSIRRTMDALSVAQLQGVQLAHHARKKQIWMSVPATDSDTRRDIYTFSYELGRWSRYETPHDSISTGNEGDGVRGQLVLVASPHWLYKQEITPDTTGAKESDDVAGLASASDYYHTYVKADSEWLYSGANCWGFKDVVASKDWPADVEGMPAIVVFAAADPSWTDPVDHPLWNGSAVAIHHTTISKIGGVEDSEIWLHDTFEDASSYTHAVLMVGSQRRRYLSQWYAPQGDGMDYVFSGMTWVNDQNVSDTDATFRMYVDQKAAMIAEYDATAHDSNDREPDFAFSFRRRGRRVQWEILNGTARDQELNIQRAILRYRIRGPRRVK